MNLRLTDEQDRVLQELADAQHISKHEAVLRAIENDQRGRDTLRSDLDTRSVVERQREGER